MEYYLATSETAFRYYGFMNFQLQLTKRIDTLPITRDYLYEDGQFAEPTCARESEVLLRA